MRIAFYAQDGDRGVIFTVRYNGIAVGSIDTRESDGMGTVDVPQGARSVEIDDIHHDVLFT